MSHLEHAHIGQSRQISINMFSKVTQGTFNVIIHIGYIQCAYIIMHAKSIIYVHGNEPTNIYA